jgi:hypothetical protein
MAARSVDVDADVEVDPAQQPDQRPDFLSIVAVVHHALGVLLGFAGKAADLGGGQAALFGDGSDLMSGIRLGRRCPDLGAVDHVGMTMWRSVRAIARNATRATWPNPG